MLVKMNVHSIQNLKNYLTWRVLTRVVNFGFPFEISSNRNFLTLLKFTAGGELLWSISRVWLLVRWELQLPIQKFIWRELLEVSTPWSRLTWLQLSWIGSKCDREWFNCSSSWSTLELTLEWVFIGIGRILMIESATWWVAWNLIRNLFNFKSSSGSLMWRHRRSFGGHRRA